MKTEDIVKRVQRRLDDEEGTYMDSDYVTGFVVEAYEELYNRLLSSGAEFDESIVELPGVPAGTGSLDDYMQPGAPLAQLLFPRTIEWKLPGQAVTYYRQADGPLDQVRDADPIPSLDSWAWSRSRVLLSQTSTALDLRLRGDFLFDALTANDSQIQMSRIAPVALIYLTCEAIGIARGNDKWTKLYGGKADDSVDDLTIIIVKEMQSKTRRVARMSHRMLSSTQYPNR